MPKTVAQGEMCSWQHLRHHHREHGLQDVAASRESEALPRNMTADLLKAVALPMAMATGAPLGYGPHKQTQLPFGLLEALCDWQLSTPKEGSSQRKQSR